jgi:hypothetical protein
MNITIEQLMAKIGRLTIQVDLLFEENTSLKNQILSLTKKPESGNVVTPVQE